MVVSVVANNCDFYGSLLDFGRYKRCLFISWHRPKGVSFNHYSVSIQSSWLASVLIEIVCIITSKLLMFMWYDLYNELVDLLYSHKKACFFKILLKTIMFRRDYFTCYYPYLVILSSLVHLAGFRRCYSHTDAAEATTTSASHAWSDGSHVWDAWLDMLM